MSMGNGSTKYPGQLKRYLRGENRINHKKNPQKTRNTQVTICINRYYPYVCLHMKRDYSRFYQTYKPTYLK